MTGSRATAGWAAAPTIGEPFGVEVRQCRAGAVQQLQTDLCGGTRDCTWSNKARTDQLKALARGSVGVPLPVAEASGWLTSRERRCVLPGQTSTPTRRPPARLRSTTHRAVRSSGPVMPDCLDGALGRLVPSTSASPMARPVRFHTRTHPRCSYDHEPVNPGGDDAPRTGRVHCTEIRPMNPCCRCRRGARTMPSQLNATTDQHGQRNAPGGTLAARNAFASRTTSDGRNEKWAVRVATPRIASRRHWSYASAVCKGAAERCWHELAGYEAGFAGGTGCAPETTTVGNADETPEGPPACQTRGSGSATTQIMARTAVSDVRGLCPRAAPINAPGRRRVSARPPAQPCGRRLPRARAEGVHRFPMGLVISITSARSRVRDRRVHRHLLECGGEFPLGQRSSVRCRFAASRQLDNCPGPCGAFTIAFKKPFPPVQPAAAQGGSRGEKGLRAQGGCCSGWAR